MEFGVRVNVNIFFYIQLVSKQSLVNNTVLDTDTNFFIKVCYVCAVITTAVLKLHLLFNSPKLHPHHINFFIDLNAAL